MWFRVKNLWMLNIVLQCKWSWRFAEGKGAFWRQVISIKYKEEGVWHSHRVRKGKKVGLWKAIKKDWDILSCKVVFFMGNGRRVRFWKDKWCGDEPLRISFPSSFAITSSKEAWVKEVWNPSSDEGCWAPCFSRRLNDWEVEIVEHFLLGSQGRRVCKDIDDKVM